MLIDMLHRGPSAKTIALLYAAVVVVAALVVIAVVPTGRPESNAGDHRRLPEYKEMLRQYKMAIKQRERAVKDELVCLYDEATRTENHKLKLFSMDQQAALELRKPRWEPKTEWEKWFPGGEFPEPLARILQQYEKRYYDASAKLQDDYEKLATDLVRRGRTKDAAALRADAKDRWALVDLKPQPPGEESLVVEPPSAEIPSPPVPPPQEPQPPMVPEKVESKDSPLDEPIVAWPEMVVEVEGPPPPPPPRRRFIDLNSFECREDNRRMRLVDACGGSDATEEAVTRARHWLVQHPRAICQRRLGGESSRRDRDGPARVPGGGQPTPRRAASRSRRTGMEVTRQDAVPGWRIRSATANKETPALRPCTGHHCRVRTIWHDEGRRIQEGRSEGVGLCGKSTRA